jgi:hypothetical protein
LLSTSSKKVQLLNIRLASFGKSFKKGLIVAKYRFSEINLNQLPIQLKSLFPYSSTLFANEPLFLKTPRVFIPGYKAVVNGFEVVPLRAKDGTLMIPVAHPDLEQRIGFQNVTLDYQGTSFMRFSHLVSLLAWFLLGFLGLFLTYLGSLPKKIRLEIAML